MEKTEWKKLLNWSDDKEISDLRMIGYSYIKQGLYDKALVFFEALTVLSPENDFDLHTLGALYLETGDNLSALNYINLSLKYSPNNEKALLNRAKTLFLLGYKKEASEQTAALLHHKNTEIANQAAALSLAYSS